MGSSKVEWAVSCVHVASGAASTPAWEPWCVTLSAAAVLPLLLSSSPPSEWRWRQRRDRAACAMRPGREHW